MDLSHIVKAKERELEERNYEKYFPIYKAALEFLSDQDVLLYGGTAIHEIVGHLYAKHQLPDLDMMATDAKGIAGALVRFFRSHKRKIVASMAPALHPGTWKVYVDGLQVADLTQVAPTMFARFRENGRATSLGVRTVNLDFLRMSLHVMLSQPFDAHRWEKAYDRWKRLFRAAPIRVGALRKGLGKDADAPHADKTPTWPNGTAAIARIPGIRVGCDAVEAFAKLRPAFAALWARHSHQEHSVFLVEGDAPALAKRLASVKKAPGAIQVRPAHPADEHFGTRVEVTVGGAPWVTLIEAPACVSFTQSKPAKPAKQAKQVNQAPSIHTLLRYYYSLHFSTGDAQPLWIAHFLEALSHQTKVPMFATDCMGASKGVITMRRERFQRIMRSSAGGGGAIAKQPHDASGL